MEKIEVVAPLRVSARKIHAFVESQQDWVISAVDKIEIKKQSVKKLAPEIYTDGAAVPYLGKMRKLSLKQTVSSQGEIESQEQALVVYLPENIERNHQSDFIKQALIDWMKKQMLKEVERIVEQHAKNYDLYPRHIRIKNLKSRWGSCGIHNDINLNWLLILAPVEVIEYVVVHELCHIKERNHSAKFWQLVKAHLPDYQVHRNWLKMNGNNIMKGI